ncbi:DUF423 domain-containing protein [Aggregatimonas sangjinii]|uniref:DUF423 domain-containing protein n=1 Tax=Aggregatimonas sangjinii TaxID=2583587 RepID=A0A5B7SJI0_9FLAO|nr:DUF423 domain-containing protein [Aggregatimonas sangjinii]QCW98586.1 DUF423 domain-containing protein [Aggregatimonas sangjinii]
MNKTIFMTGIILGVLAVILGAFGAHGLEKVLDTDAIDTFETGVTYQMYHALLLLVLGGVIPIPERTKKVVYYLMTLGVVLFSFSIYFLATNALTGFDFRTIGFITPIGGTLLIAGWGWLGLGCIRHFN